MKHLVILLALVMNLIGCESNPTPRPKGYFRIALPSQEYKIIECNLCGYSSSVNQSAFFSEKNLQNQKIYYPSLEGELFLTYRNNQQEFKQILKETQKLIYKHTIVSSGIVEQPFNQPKRKVYGTYYMLKGDVASPLQFIINDKTSRILHGALYFNAKPKMDSLQPLINYIDQDLKLYLERFRWKL